MARLTIVTVLAIWCMGALGRYTNPLDLNLLDSRMPFDCGIEGHNRTCPAGSCCSRYSKCGTTSRHCGLGCQSTFSNSCDPKARSVPSGAETEHVPRPKIGNVPYGQEIRGCSRNGVVALTFDDGPFVNKTDRLLDLLAEHDVRATFFVAGSNKDKGLIDDEATGYPQTLRRMMQVGHQIASHTWSHPRNLNNLSPDQLRREMMYNEMALRNVLGRFPTYMRAPRLRCGAACRRFMEEWGYHVIHTNLNTKDWSLEDISEIEESKSVIRSGLAKSARQSSHIVVAHDTTGDIALELARLTINLARENGYELVTVGECLNDKSVNWYREAAN
ncbi:hypothetical protein HIM_02204 [Hirsutella minnesotensis 3608]|nr:hypothetical protein HIM_02204 [Hirsutella minnesotensis 3608]